MSARPCCFVTSEGACRATFRCRHAVAGMCGRCPDCQGQGRVPITTERYGRHIVECETCEGSGQVAVNAHVR